MSEQTRFTRSGKEVIPVTLLGQNRDYRVLKEPAKPAYPKGDEVRYTDDYVFRLQSTYSLNEVLGVHVQDIAQRKGLQKFVMGSPLGVIEAEDILAYMLVNSAQAGGWQPFIVDVPSLTDTSIQTSNEYIQNINPAHNSGKVEGGVLFGLKVARKDGFAFILEYDTKVVVVPSQSFIEYILHMKKELKTSGYYKKL